MTKTEKQTRKKTKKKDKKQKKQTNKRHAPYDEGAVKVTSINFLIFL